MRENSRRTIRPSKAARRAWPTILAVVLAAGVVAAVLFVSNILSNTSNISGTALTLAYEVGSPKPEDFTFVGTAYSYTLRVTNNAAQTLTPDVTIKISKSGIVPSDVSLKVSGTVFAPTQTDANTLVFVKPSVTATLIAGGSATFDVNVTFNVAGLYTWAQQVTANA